MKSISTAKFLSYVSHPLRITIIRLLYAAPRSFSDLLKYLSLESTSRLSFHLDTLGPLITKNGDGNYILSSEGHISHSFLVSIENDEVIDDLLPVIGRKEVGALPLRERFLQFVKRPPSVFYHYIGVLFVLGGLYQLFRTLGQDNTFLFFESFTNPFSLVFFFFLVGFFVHFIFFCRIYHKSFSYLISGMISFILLYSAFLSFLDQTHYFINAILALPEEYYQFNPQTGHWEKEEWFYFAGTLPEIFWGYLKTILFNEFLYPQNTYYLHLDRAFFWLMISIILIIFLYLISPLVGWKWSSSLSTEPIFFPRKLQILEDKRFWLSLITLYFFIIIFSSPWIFDASTQRQLEFFLPPDGSFIPSYIHFVPILPTMVICIVILLINFTRLKNQKKLTFLLVILIVIEPTVFLLLIIGDSILFMNVLFEITTPILLISKLLIILIQILGLTGFLILFKKLIEPVREFSTS
ncbi:MAG: hypothetical protein ACFFB2_11255 [Promethearchaeota archaeon]